MTNPAPKLTRWQRFKHAFQACRGREVKREYVPPHGRAIKGWGVETLQLIDEAVHGVTLFHYECRVCGKRFTNREIGDWRKDAEN